MKSAANARAASVGSYQKKSMRTQYFGVHGMQNQCHGPLVHLRLIQIV